MSAGSDITSTNVLLQQLNAGDDRALAELYSRYVSRVLACVRARLGGELRRRVESWDIVQDAMLASLKNVRTFEFPNDGAFLNWWSKIVENRIRDQLDFHHAARRDHRREVRVEGGETTSAGMSILAERKLPTPSQLLILSEQFGLLERALDRLPEETRELIVAIKLEGRSYQDLAQEQGKSPDAIRMQVNRALVALTSAYRELESEPDRNER